MRHDHSAVAAWALLGLAILACQPGGAPAGRDSPMPSAGLPSPAVRARPPAVTVLDDPTVGLPRSSGRDHLSAVEAARDQPDEVLALEAFSGFAWADASSRRWALGGRAVADLVVLTFSEDGAARAFAYWQADASRAPLVGGPCPPEVVGLDRCVFGSGGGRSLVAGMLGREVFRLEGDSADVARLAPVQAARLRV